MRAITHTSIGFVLARVEGAMSRLAAAINAMDEMRHGNYRGKDVEKIKVLRECSAILCSCVTMLEAVRKDLDAIKPKPRGRK